jgi:hypothetical protein
VDLVLTDPPHSDRIPYLELSELWNSMLGIEPDFEREIVVSNAKERKKTDGKYVSDLSQLISELPRVLSPRGFFVLLFNAREAEDWSVFRKSLKGKDSLTYIGHFPCVYSAGSVVQDNRDGSLKHDYAMIFANTSCAADNTRIKDLLSTVPGWSNNMPPHLLGD